MHKDTLTDLVVDGEIVTTTEDCPFWSETDQRFSEQINSRPVRRCSVQTDRA